MVSLSIHEGGLVAARGAISWFDRLTMRSTVDRSSMTNSILEMRSITKTCPGVKALSDVNLDVREAEIHAIVGENGAGKSTLMKVLSGVYPAGSYDGQIVYKGEEQHFKSIRDSEHKGIVIIHQELALVPLLSIAERSEEHTSELQSPCNLV